MRKPLPFFALTAAAALLQSAPLTHASTIGYWRMETDTNPGGGLSVPNEVAGNPLTAPAASLAPDVPSSTVPQTNQPNTASLNGDANINGTIAYYAALDTTGSFTAELYARTLEGAGYLLARGTGITPTETSNGPTTDGFMIGGFGSNLNVKYVLDNDTVVTVASGFDINATWAHIAFTYDAQSGIGRLYANGNLLASSSATPGHALKWAAGTDLYVGGGMDGGTLSSSTSTGLVDELRLSDTALTPTQFLTAPIPEPATLAALLPLSLAAIRRR